MEESRLSDIDWDAAASEAAEILSAYIKINTCNPPGNEIAGIAFIEAPSTTLVLPPGKHVRMDEWSLLWLS